jgi:hypothetical protein
MRGAGGTEGGLGRFIVGLIMLIVGGYLLLDAIQVRSPGFGLGYGLYSFGGFQLRTGMILIPMIFGIGMIFYDAKAIIGWGPRRGLAGRHGGWCARQRTLHDAAAVELRPHRDPGPIRGRRRTPAELAQEPAARAGPLERSPARHLTPAARCAGQRCAFIT